MITTSNARLGRTRRILLVTWGAGGTSAHLFTELNHTLSVQHQCRNLIVGLDGRSLPQRALAAVAGNLRHMGDVLQADVVITHVPALLSLPMLVLARMSFKKIVIFQWDVYPTTIAGRPYMTSLPRRIAHWFERLCLRLANVIVLPSEDFRPMAPVRDPVIFPLWPQAALPMEPIRSLPAPDGVFHIAFAGQVNELRGLRECVAHLRTRSRKRIVLHVFSANPVDIPPQEEGVLHIEQHGHLPRAVLQARLRDMHFGLISLNPQLDQPGFPSKTFDYLAAGLPVLYFGRPLPGFTGPLASCGAGIDITPMAEIDPATIYRDLITGLEAGRDNWLAYTRLDPERLAPLL